MFVGTPSRAFETSIVKNGSFLSQSDLMPASKGSCRSKWTPSHAGDLKSNSGSTRATRYSGSGSFGVRFGGHMPSLDSNDTRKKMQDFLKMPLVQFLSVLLVLFSVYLICADTDARARGSAAPL